MKTTRRNFIKTVSVPVITAPFILPSRVWMFPPGRRITMGFVGMGKQSEWLLEKFKELPPKAKKDFLQRAQKLGDGD